MLQVRADSSPYIAACTLILAFLSLPVTWNCQSWSSYAFFFWDIMGSKYGLHLWACSLITTCRWSLMCNWGDHSLVTHFTVMQISSFQIPGC